MLQQSIASLSYYPRAAVSASAVVRMAGIVTLVMIGFAAVRAQTVGDTRDVAKTEVVEGVIEGNAYGVGKSLRINGTVKDGAVALGGDVIVQGTVLGDVAAIGGSVIQLEGAHIGGDVIVVGGTYRAIDKTPQRKPAAMTVIYAGYEHELQQIISTPSGLLSPPWSATFIGLRLLSILFWFIISMVLTATLPRAIGSGVARLQLTSLRVGAIGFLAAVVVALFGEACLYLLPTPVSVILALIGIMVLVVSGIFGRVIIYAATGRFVQRHLLKSKGNSEAIALLIGAIFWGALSSLPYIWPFVIALMVVLSLGLTLTAGRRRSWNKAPAI